MSYTLFFGPSHTGKSHVALYTSKILANAGKKIMVLEYANNQSIMSYFNINTQIEDKTRIIREGIDILSCNLKENIDFNVLNTKDYDHVIIKADHNNIPLNTLKNIKNCFLVLDCDKGAMFKSVELLKYLEKQSSEIKPDIVFNKFMQCKLKKNIVIDQLLLNDTKSFEIPFSESDYLIALNNKVDGRLKINKFTDYHNWGLYEIASIIGNLALDRKSFKKLIK